MEYTSCGSHLASVEKPWLQFFSKEAINTPLPECSLYSMVKNGCREYNSYSNTALNYYGTFITYSEMLSSIEQYAAAFKKLGVKEGEYVSFVTVAIPETIYAFYALNKIGAVANFIDPRTDASHVKQFVEKARSRFLIVIENVWDKVSAFADELDLVIVQSSLDSLSKFKAFAKGKPAGLDIPFDKKNIIKNSQFAVSAAGETVPDAEYKPDMPAAVTRTGGTTGTSKGVILTNDGINAVVCTFRDAGYGQHTGDRLLNFLPIAASYGIVCGVHLTHALSFEDILIPVFKPDDFANLIMKHKPNHIVGVPMFYEKLINSRKARHKDLSFLLTMGSGGDTANQGLKEKLDVFRSEHNIKNQLIQGYGLSETTSAVVLCLRNAQREGSCGVPTLYINAGIFDPETGKELPFGESGEICISGPTLMKEYLYEPEETANVLITHKDGSIWMHTGDLGHIDEDGFLFIEGRMKRSIIRFDGHKNYPVQIEDEASKHPAVENCSVIPVADLDHKQGHLPLVVAELVPLAEGETRDDNITAFDILTLCKEHLEARSWPAGVVIVDRIPFLEAGKNDIKTLTEQFGNYNYKENKL